jgi:DNA repair exonuclease SbcCD nuclease subunit
MLIDSIFIGDPHIQVSNFPEIDLLLERLIKLVNEKNPKFIVIAGDILHDHERLHTMALNKAYEFIDKLRMLSPTYILVGNHDYYNNQQYLTSNHWMNGLKEWRNVTIVDKVLVEQINNKVFTFVPYVPPGRFEECLIDSGLEWEESICIFAHQEFLGCKMGAIVSIEGDKWPVDYPDIISGHIHSKQKPQDNIYYPGSSIQIAFGESEKNIIACLNFEESRYKVEEVNLNLPRKKTIYLDIMDIDDYKVKENEDKIKLTLSGNHDEFKAFKKTKKYKDLLSKNIKVVFKPKKIKKIESSSPLGDEIIEKLCDSSNTDFKSILSSIIVENKDPYLYQAYELIINDKETLVDDIFFV